MSREEQPEDATSRFAEAWARCPPGDAVLAVSGGSDSMALMHLAVEAGALPAVATVDHGLRAGSAAEAAAVAEAAAALDLEHVTLRWQPPEAGNLQGAAREGRYSLIAEWARGQGIGTIVTAHTIDDQAETVLMRLIRGSGIDGLSAMRELSETHGVALFRPLLGENRQALRACLTARGVPWIDDPSNEDPRFDRVHVRKAMEILRLEPHRLAQTAGHMARAQDLLERLTVEWIDNAVIAEGEGVSADASAFRALHPELRLRALAAMLCRVGGKTYRPRFRALSDLDRALDDPAFPGSTLHGCRIRVLKGHIVVTPEA